MGENERTIRNLIDAFNGRDVNRIMECFTEDAVYHNMPGPPATGRDAVRALIDSYLTPAEIVDWEILFLAETGPVVLTERIDRFKISGRDVALPCMGTFEMENAKIRVWRDYFDLATWQRQMKT